MHALVKSKGVFQVMDGTGDTKHIWDKNKPAEVEAARALFESLTSKMYIAYKVKKNGEPGEVVKKFDPDMEKVIFIPPVVGG